MRFKLAVFLSTVGRREYALKNYAKDDVVLLDEGVLQRLLSLSEQKNDTKRYQGLVAKSSYLLPKLCRDFGSQLAHSGIGMREGYRRERMPEEPAQRFPSFGHGIHQQAILRNCRLHLIDMLLIARNAHILVH